MTVINYQSTSLLVKQATVCTLMTERTPSHQPDAFICIKSLWACKSLELTLSALFWYSNICWGWTLLVAPYEATHSILDIKLHRHTCDGLQRPTDKRRSYIQVELHSLSCSLYVFAAIWLTVWIINRVCFTCCWMSCIIAHPVVVIILIRREKGWE